MKYALVRTDVLQHRDSRSEDEADRLSMQCWELLSIALTEAGEFKEASAANDKARALESLLFRLKYQ